MNIMSQNPVKDVLKQIKRIEIATRNKSYGSLSGNYYSIFKGQGLEFSEIREYRLGDDVRTIDWKVTARLNVPYVKEFIEERNLQVYIILDISGSGSFGNNVSKKYRALEIIASLSFKAIQNSDTVGAFLFTDKIEKFIPAKGGKKHMLQILYTINSYEAKSKKTNIASCLKKISKIIKKPAMLILISDFFDSNEFIKELQVLRKKHDIVSIMIVDEREQSIPNVGLIELEDEETGEQMLVDTSSKEFQKEYRKITAKHETDLIKKLRKSKVDFAKVLSDEPYEIPLRKLFRYRTV
ncbi:MAG: hypothetical protein K8823_423 [Cenarchaeum symbiont of Oopsacas minuta]|nr:hypothetical protein [Cenarchaeum symbiont of Oopsacas minuta]